ncbi:MAG: hypothetical protein ACP5MI_10550, partial [Candidatus Kryptoniota bacterium]
IKFAPLLGIGSVVDSAEVDGKPIHFETQIFPEGIQPIVVAKVVRSQTKFDVHFVPTVELLPPSVETRTGDSDHGLKIFSVRMNGNVMHVEVEGLAGMKYNLNIVNPDRVESVSGGKLNGNSIEFTIPPGAESGFVKHEISIVTV